MSLRLQFIKHVGPGGMSGCTLSEWFAHLKRNRFVVSPQYWPRVALTTFNSAMNSRWAKHEQQFDSQVAATEVAPPLIVLGVWRSGTTHLHNLLSKDARFAFPNTYQALFSNTFLSSEAKTAPSLDNFMAPTRPMDNVRLGTAEPQEDEYALAPSGLSYICEFAFPRTGSHYRRFMTLQDATEDEVQQWKSKLLWFLKKLTFKYQRPLVLKSPGHTCRIKLLLEMFPEAKFVHIRRNPFAVFRSTLHTVSKTFPYWMFQSYEDDHSQLLANHAELYRVFFEERDLIPPNNFCEIAYEDLDAQPVETIRSIYEQLALPSFEHMEPTLRAYVDSIDDYRKNSLLELPEPTRRMVSQRLAQCFDAWGYESAR